MNSDIRKIIEKGDLHNLKKCKINNHIELLAMLKFAASQPHLQLFIHLFNLDVKNLVITTSICLSIASEAVKHNQLNNLKYTYKKILRFQKVRTNLTNSKQPIKPLCFINKQLSFIAISNNGKEFIQYFHDVGYQFTHEDLLECVKHDRLKIMKFIINSFNDKNKFLSCKEQLFFSACELNKHDIIDYLIKSHNTTNVESINHAIKGYQLDTVKHLMKKLRIDKLNYDHILIAIKNKKKGNSQTVNKLLQYLFENCIFDKSQLKNICWLNLQS